MSEMEINAYLEGRDSRAERAGVAREVCMRGGNASAAVGAKEVQGGLAQPGREEERRDTKG